MPPFRFNPAYSPVADQPPATAELAEGLGGGDRFQTLLGVTGSGKTATMGFVIEQVQKPALVLAHNKTLAAQLCSEFREFFPDNAVEYFVSYYDYYQPEAYVPHQDLYIEKDSSINDEIDRLRHSATAALFARKDVIIVASVSAIYGIGSPQLYKEKMLLLQEGRVDRPRRHPAAARVDAVHAQRHEPLARHLPRAGRGARGPSGICGERLPSAALRRRGRADPALRPAHRRGPPRPRPRRHLARDPLRDGRRHRPALRDRDEARAERALQGARARGQAAGVAPPAPAHRVRHGDAQGDGLLLGDRELLADPRRPPGRLAAPHADRLLPGRLRRLHRRVASDGSSARRDVRGRPLPQADAGRLRLPPAIGDGQPPAAVRRVPEARAADGVRLRHAGTVRAGALDAHGRADRAADRDRGPDGRGARDAPPDRRPDERDPRARRGERARAGHHADEEDGRGPHRLPARVRVPRALPALRDRHDRAHPDHPGPAARRIRRAGRREPAARGARPARGVADRRSSTPTRRASCAERPA